MSRWNAQLRHLVAALPPARLSPPPTARLQSRAPAARATAKPPQESHATLPRASGRAPPGPDVAPQPLASFVAGGAPLLPPHLRDRPAAFGDAMWGGGTPAPPVPTTDPSEAELTRRLATPTSRRVREFWISQARRIGQAIAQLEAGVGSKSSIASAAVQGQKQAPKDVTLVLQVLQQTGECGAGGSEHRVPTFLPRGRGSPERCRVPLRA